MYLVIIICTIFITGCSNTEKEVEALLGEAEEYIEQKDYTNAIGKFERIIELTNDSQYNSRIEELTEKNVEVLLEEAEEYIEQKDYTNAIVKFEGIIELTNDLQYKSKIEELKTKQEIIEKDIGIVKKTIDELRGVLYNPESLQVNEVIIYRSESNWASVYMDYSAMNKMGGFARDYAYAAFTAEILQEGSFFPDFESNYRSAEEDLNTEDETYYFDVNLIKGN